MPSWRDNAGLCQAINVALMQSDDCGRQPCQWHLQRRKYQSHRFYREVWLNV
jgi:hypothetical protein